MGGKRRVHELAKELGVTSTEILAELREAGEAVKSASSTIEAPAARRLREVHSANPQRSKADTAQTSNRKGAKPAAGKKKKLARRREPTQSQIATICERYRVAAAAANPVQSVDQFYLDCEATYGLPRKRVKVMIAADARRNPQKYLPLQIQRARSTAAQRTNANTVSVKRQIAKPTPRRPTADPDKGRTNRTRIRTAGLPPISATVDVDGVATIISETTNEPREAVEARLQEIVPTQAGDYGYLSWRYGSSRRDVQPGSRTTTAAKDLAVLANFIDIEKHLVRALEQAHGLILEDPELAKRVLDNRFDQLASDDEDLSGLGYLGSNQSRRASARFDFLRRAIVLTIARPTNDERLWNMLADLQSRTLTGTAPELRRANQRLAELIASTDRLLATDSDALNRFFHRSRAELLALRDGRYDFLIPFREDVTARQAPAELAFELLPPGEQTQKFLDDIRRSGCYFGQHVDDRRLGVLEHLQKHFTPARCRLHKGSITSSGVDNRYLVLAITSADGTSEDAVAISPLAGLHATYVVRRECADADWPSIFAGPKPEARRQGARKLLFVGNDAADPYNAMRNKVINLLESDGASFLNDTGRANRLTLRRRET